MLPSFSSSTSFAAARTADAFCSAHTSTYSVTPADAACRRTRIAPADRRRQRDGAGASPWSAELSILLRLALPFGNKLFSRRAHPFFQRDTPALDASGANIPADQPDVKPACARGVMSAHQHVLPSGIFADSIAFGLYLRWSDAD